MADVLHAIAPVELLAPEDVPDAAALAARLKPAARKACLAALAAPATGAQAALAALTRTMPRDAPKPWQDVRFLIDAGQTADESTHDHFFRIRRSAHRDPLGYLRGLFLALDRLARDLAEAPTSLSDEAIAELGEGLTAAIAAALGVEPAAARFEALRAARPARPDFEKWRWIRGHQVFAPLTQGLIFCADALEAAEAPVALARAGELFVKLMIASARVLEYAGDISAEVYREQIRDAMDAPFQPRGFSGILSGDHRRFTGRMRAMRPAIDRLKTQHPQIHARLVAALTQVYDSHKCVCGRFVGTDKASLLMAQECSRSAVEQIDKFKQMRLRTLQ